MNPRKSHLARSLSPLPSVDQIPGALQEEPRPTGAHHMLHMDTYMARPSDWERYSADHPADCPPDTDTSPAQSVRTESH